MKKALFFILGSAPVFVLALDPSYYTVDVINKSQFPVYVKIYKPNAKKDEKPKVEQEYSPGEWQLAPGAAKYNEKLGWKDQYTYTKLNLQFTVNYTGVNQNILISEIYDIPKNFQNTNDFIVTIDIQKKTGKQGTNYLERLIKLFYPYETQGEHRYLTKQKANDWAWVPVVTFTPKNS